MQNDVRHINAWLLVPAVLLALGVGTLLGRAVQDDDPAVASGAKTEVLGEQITKDADETTTTTATTEAPAADASPAVGAAPTAAAATTTTTVVHTTVATTATTAKPAAPTTTAARRVTDNGCGDGAATAKGNFRITGDGPPNDPFFTYSGPATVTNNTTKAIQIDSLEVRITSADGTVERVQVPGAVGTVVQPGTAKDFAFDYTTKHEPKEGGAQMGTFAYRAPGGSASCATT